MSSDVVKPETKNLILCVIASLMQSGVAIQFCQQAKQTPQAF